VSDFKFGVDGNLGGDGNVRSRGYFVVRTSGKCRHCRASTPLIALALPPEHEILSAEAEERSENPAPEAWEAVGCGALLFYVAGLPDSVKHRVAQFSRRYRRAFSAATQESYWANHCGRCGSLLEDHDLFCEPDGAFLPMSGASTPDLELIWIDESIEAQAGGYSCDPALFVPAVRT
jgi:hypothetical protein